jgi:hypothetical protein
MRRMRMAWRKSHSKWGAHGCESKPARQGKGVGWEAPGLGPEAVLQPSTSLTLPCTSPGRCVYRGPCDDSAFAGHSLCPIAQDYAFS